MGYNRIKVYLYIIWLYYHKLSYGWVVLGHSPSYRATKTTNPHFSSITSNCKLILISMDWPDISKIFLNYRRIFKLQENFQVMFPWLAGFRHVPSKYAVLHLIGRNSVYGVQLMRNFYCLWIYHRSWTV